MNNGSEYFVVSCTEQSMILEQVYSATLCLIDRFD